MRHPLSYALGLIYDVLHWQDLYVHSATRHVTDFVLAAYNVANRETQLAAYVANTNYYLNSLLKPESTNTDVA